MATVQSTEVFGSNRSVLQESTASFDNHSWLHSDISAENQTNHHYWNLPFSVTLATILSISSFLSIVGNLMVITVVIRHRGMRTRTNLFLVNLAVADFCVGAMAVPIAIITLVKGDWVLGVVLCQIDGFINVFFFVASIHTLMYISIHKYYSITRPFSNSIQLHKVLLMMAATWVWAAFLGAITVSGLNVVQYKPGTSQCGPSYPKDLKGFVHHGITQLTGIFIPLVIMIFCYVRMFKVIREHTHRLQENTTLEQDVVLAQQKKVAMTLFIVLACFIMCWIPYHIYASYVSYMKDKAHFSEYINPPAYMFGYMNSAFNPIIYAFRSPSFREGYKEILCQTPTYIVTDASHSNRRCVEKYNLQGTSSCEQDTIPDVTPHFFRRMSSTVSSPMQRSQSVPDATFRKLSSGSTASSTVMDNRLKFQPQKSLTELMRSAAKFGKGSSVIESNGSIIIMKGGKIVSVRSESRLSPRSPVMKHDHKFMANGCSKNSPKINGNHVELAPLVLKGSDKQLPPLMHNDSDIELAPLISKGCDTNSENRASSGSDEVFDKTCKEDSIDNKIKSEQLATSKCPDSLSTEHKNTNTDLEQNPTNGDRTETDSPVPDVQCCNGDKNCASDGESCCQTKTDCGIIINIDEDNSVLSVMPLTPHIKHKIATSDLFLSRDEKNTFRKKSAAKSTENIFRPPFMRLPSVEHLDLPVSLARSVSDTNVRFVRQSPLLKPRRDTFGKIESQMSNEQLVKPCDDSTNL